MTILDIHFIVLQVNLYSQHNVCLFINGMHYTSIHYIKTYNMAYKNQRCFYNYLLIKKLLETSFKHIHFK